MIGVLHDDDPHNRHLRLHVRGELGPRCGKACVIRQHGEHAFRFQWGRDGRLEHGLGI